MSSLSIDTLTFPAADLGEENPLTPLTAYGTASTPNATPAPGKYPDRGREVSILPYRLQDQYTRQRHPRAFKTAVLENRHLRATFLLERGGRLWSLIDKATGQELLFVNPVFQPANLAIRDAWFSGGVEWNISVIGHCAFTCSDLFAARVLGDNGEPILRLYEWDRVRRVPFQIDCWLADDRPFLFVRVRITNPNDHMIPMYWWSNIAVPERDDVRVLGPANKAYRHDYDGALVEHNVPLYEGVDVSYTTRRAAAADLYFQIPQGHRPWIAALDGQARGLVHTSTDRLFGRKMFNWGTHSGGRRWQEFLAESGHAYIEIQGGLAHTQGEYVPMPAKADWSWLEAYGPLQADRAIVHGDDWQAAWKHAEAKLEIAMPCALVAAEFERTAAMADRAPIEILHHGSGWGALENRRRRAAGQPDFASTALPFPPETMTADQSQWIELLDRGALPPHDVKAGPGSLMVQPEWRTLLERSATRSLQPNWSLWYHLAVMRYRAGELGPAKAAWGSSFASESNAWALRDLAVLAQEEGNEPESADHWLAAARMLPEQTTLQIECGRSLLRARRFAEWIRYVAQLPPAVQSHGRIRLLHAMASLEVGDLATVESFFVGDLQIANIREKEVSLSDLWFEWQARKQAAGGEVTDTLRRRARREFPPPSRFDFRLNLRDVPSD